MSEKQNRLFQLSFNWPLKADFQESRIASDGGLILVRELDERLGFGDFIAQDSTDSWRGKNTRLPQDPTFRRIGSEKIREGGAARTSGLQFFQAEVPAKEANFAGLAAINREPVGKAESAGSRFRLRAQAGGGHPWTPVRPRNEESQVLSNQQRRSDGRTLSSGRSKMELRDDTSYRLRLNLRTLS